METDCNSFKYVLLFKVPVATGSCCCCGLLGEEEKNFSSAYLVLANENEQNILNVSKLTKVSV